MTDAARCVPTNIRHFLVKGLLLVLSEPSMDLFDQWAGLLE